MQTQRIKAAAGTCAAALKRLSSMRLKAQVKAALKGKEPEQVYGLLNDIALKASVMGKLSAASMSALRTLQGAYHAVLAMWVSTPSEKHRDEMNALFHSGLRKPTPRRRKA